MSAPALREVRRGRAADELVLIDADGRAILLRSDGLTDDERIRMRERAIAVLSGSATTHKQQDGSTRRGNDAPSLARRPKPLGSHDLTGVALPSVHQRFSETQDCLAPRGGAARYTAASAVTSKA
jgi:hypothetical protein